MFKTTNTSTFKLLKSRIRHFINKFQTPKLLEHVTDNAQHILKAFGLVKGEFPNIQIPNWFCSLNLICRDKIKVESVIFVENKCKQIVKTIKNR